MSLVTFDNVTLSFGDQPLLNKASFNIEANDKICLLGRNGEGKSSLLKLILQPQNVDSGNIRFNSKINIGYLDQHLPEPSAQTVYDYIATALAKEQQLLQQFEQLSQSSTVNDLTAMESLQKQIDALGAWDIDVKINKVINLLELPKQKLMNELSGGWRRRVALGKALVNNPELLLLDEPTNHLDILAINWLKKCMQQFNGALLFITHDRDFLKSTANELLELDRGNLTTWQCDYPTYLTRKEDLLATEQQHNALFDKKLAKEEVWIRQGIKARRTRNEGRVRKLKALRNERQQRRSQQGGAKFSIGTNQNSGKLVIKVKNISYSYENQPIVNDFSFRLTRGDKVGLIGANGVGKSTLIKLLLGQLKPQSGSVNVGTNLDIAYFDQQRSQLNLERSVIDNLAEGQTEITINGKRKHVIGYLGDFLFSPQRCQAPVKVLSGGERNRLLLARLFSKSANFLVLDEPTNDLDVETLELLESLLVDFTGTVLLVSHDTEFLNNTVSSSLVFYPNSKIKEYVGGFDDWVTQGGSIDQLIEDKIPVEKNTTAIKDGKLLDIKPNKPAKKLSYKLKLELEQLPDEIEKCEEELKALQQVTEQSDFYNHEVAYTQSIWQQITDLQQTIEQKLQRWQELDDLSSNN